MRVSLTWLKELLPGLEIPHAQIAEHLTQAGLEVEAITHIGAGAEPAVIADVQKIEPHPKRSGLKLVSVDRGGATVTVVCGASNVPQPGGQVVLAPLGTVLPGVGELKARELGGVLSEGMLLSEAELGLAEDSEGILVLDAGRFAAGSPLFDALPAARDTIFELGITPNRPDALGHVGVARELGAILDLPFSPPQPGDIASFVDDKLDDLIEIENRDTERCPIYGAGVVLGVQVGPSPEWLRWRLSLLGVRPISNIVDITNLLLLQFGQPLHAFNLDQVGGAKIIVRRAAAKEPFTTLDGEKHTLSDDDLVIADAEAPSALAGVMGGLDSEIKDDTTRVLLECAYLQPRGVRRTARRHGLSTEASFRFERGVDHGAVPLVLEHAKALLAQLAGGKVVRGQILASGPKIPIPTIRLRKSRIDALLGTEVPFDQALNLLQRLGFAKTSSEDGVAELSGASWRPDTTLEVDLIEEVARGYGFDKIPTLLPAIAPQEPRTAGDLERQVIGVATALGLSEAVTYSFVSEKELTAVHAPPPVVSLLNPLSEERSVMRTSLLPGLLDAVGRAQRHGQRAVRLFSVGSLFLKPNPDRGSPAAVAARPRLEGDPRVLPEERPSLAVVIAGPRPGYLGKPQSVDVWDAKGLAEELLRRISGRDVTTSAAKGSDEASHLHPRGAAFLLIDEVVVGHFGPLHPDVSDRLDLLGEVFATEIDLAAIEALPAPVPRFKPIPRLPAVTRDLAIVVRQDIAAAEVERVIRQQAGDLCEAVELFDLFRGGSVPEGHRSLAFHIVYRDPLAASNSDKARTLTDKEVDKRHKQVVQAAQSELGAELRT